MSGVGKAALIAVAAAAAAAAGVVWLANAAKGGEGGSTPKAAAAGAGAGAGAGSGDEEVRTRSRRSSSTGSIVRGERERSSSWQEPLYAREAQPTSVVDEMLTKARARVRIIARKAQQLVVPVASKLSQDVAADAGAPSVPSEATRTAVLELMNSTSEHGVHWMLSAVANGLDLAAMVTTFKRLSSRGRPSGEQGHTIDVDLARTFPSDPDFVQDGAKFGQLRQVLYAISHHVQGGYTQGMNFVAGHLLRHASPPLAFALLTYIVDSAKFRSRSVFEPTREATEAISNELRRLVHAQVPSMAAHLERVSFDYNLFMKWYVSVFASVLPDGAALNDVWDVLFSFGWTATLFAIVAMLQTVEYHVHTGNCKLEGRVVDDLDAYGFEETYALLESFGKTATGADSTDGTPARSHAVVGVEAPTNLGKRAVKLMMASRV